MTAGCIPDKILIKDDSYCAIFVSASPKVDCEHPGGGGGYCQKWAI